MYIAFSILLSYYLRISLKILKEIKIRANLYFLFLPLLFLIAIINNDAVYGAVQGAGSTKVYLKVLPCAGLYLLFRKVNWL